MIRTPMTDICRLFVANLCLLAGVALTSASLDAQAQRGAQKPLERNSASPKEVKFEVISIKPIKADAPGIMSIAPTLTGYRSQMAVWQMIKLAYVPGFDEEWQNAPLLNAPKWLYEDGSNNYAVDARVSKKDEEAWQHQGPQRELLRSALRALLRERCKLVIHTEPKEVPDYKLVIAGKKHTMMENAPDPKLTPFATLPGGGYWAHTKSEGRRVLEVYFHGVTMGEFCVYLSGGGGTPIHDETGLSGRYDFKLRARDRSDEFDNGVTPWLVESLGLKLKPGKYQGYSIVIDHIEKPSAN
jgi:uncharacterized protein (TIGR03435 family)